MKQLCIWMFVVLLIVLIVDPSDGGDRLVDRRRKNRRNRKRQRQQRIQNVQYLYAMVEVKPNPSIPSSNVRGVIHFRQKIASRKTWATEYNLTLTGFNNTDNIKAHGSHIHTYGTISGGCEGAGGHYNPTGTPHGLPSQTESRHIGDLANVLEDDKGDSHALTSNNKISLTGLHSIVGRTWDVHVTVDDGLQPSGHAGPRLACGVVVVSDGAAAWN